MVMAVWHSVRRLTEIDEGYGLMRRRDGEWSVARSLRVEACLHEGMVSGALAFASRHACMKFSFVIEASQASQKNTNTSRPSSST